MKICQHPKPKIETKIDGHLHASRKHSFKRPPHQAMWQKQAEEPDERETAPETSHITKTISKSYLQV